jgi:putative ABC transport system substrate-binding protein
MTTRREALLTLPLLCAASRIRAQVPVAGPPKRLGYLGSNPDPKTPPEQRPFGIGMRQKGWIHGDNLLREFAFTDGQAFERFPQLAEELVRKRVDAILSAGDVATVAAARATRTIPIVFVSVAYPVEEGLIDSYARPGRNATGLTLFAGIEVVIKRLELLRN